MKKIIYPLFFLLSLCGCKKENNLPITTIEGKVINAGSKQPVDSVKVIAVDGVTTYNNFFGTTTSTSSGRYEITYTNAKGEFNISIRGNSPCIFLAKSGYQFVVVTYGSSDNYKSYNAGKTYNNEILGLWAQAHFNGSFICSNCTSTDTSVIGVDEGNHIPLSWIKIGFVYKGKGPHFGDINSKGLSEFGDSYTPYWIVYQIKGVWQPALIDSVFIKSFTTYTDTIYY